jgi:hypothetical protein
MVVRRKSQHFGHHLCPRLQVTDVSGETVCARYRPARVPRSCWCVSQWELSVGVKSLLHPSRRDAKNIRDTSVGQPEKSAVVDHSFNTGHCIDFSSTIVLDRTSSYMDHLVKDAVGMRLNNLNFNRVCGLMLSSVWHPVVNMLSNQEAGLMQQTLDTNRQLPLASAPT